MVVAIIAVLIALLLPALNAARRQAARVACLSNLRQLGVALIAYAHANDGRLPGPACGAYPRAHDWVHWEPNRRLDESAIAPYLGSGRDVLKCPLGRPDALPATFPDGTPRHAGPPYPFSYSVNVYFTGADRTTGSVPYWEPPPCKLPRARNASRKILAVEEDLRTIADGAWFFSGDPFGPSMQSYPSARHEGDGLEVSPGRPFYGRRANIVFADGHGEFIRREIAQGRPYVDPVFFYDPTYTGRWE